MRMTLTDRNGRQVTFERHLRIEGVPDQTATSFKIGAGPIVRFTPEQEEQIRQFYLADPKKVVGSSGAQWR